MSSVPETYGTENSFRMIVAGGGTGGHLFPGIAIAQAFLARHSKNRVLFINAGRPLEVEVLSRLGWPHEVIPVEGLKGRGLWNQLQALIKTPKAISRSRRLIKAFDPHVVLGVGGYSAGPVVLTAWLLGVATVLHEQNQLPGLTNRLLRRIVDRIYLTFPDDAGRFDAAKTVVTGNPVRDEILVLGSAPKTHDDRRFTVLILGGSQGARAINQAMVEALPYLADRPQLVVVHQTGREEESQVAGAYKAAGVQANVQAFFNNVAEQYQQADLIICRAGATTVAEITTVGRAAIFVPYPFAADDHQTCNARALVDTGAAEMVHEAQLNGRILAEKIQYLMDHRSRLSDMAAKALSLGRPDATLAIISDLYKLIEGQAIKRRDALRDRQEENVS